jgi:TonB family protein
MQEKDMQHLTFRLTIAFLSSLACLFASAFSATAQEEKPSINDESKWEKYTGKGEAFTILLPAPPTAAITYRPARFILSSEAERYRGTLYNAYSNGVVYLIYSFPRRSEPLERYMNEFANRYSRMQEVVSSRQLNINGASGQRHLIKFRDVDGVLDFYLTNNRVYIIHIIGADENNPSVKRVLESFTLRDAAATDKATETAAIEIKPGSKKSPQTDDSQPSSPVYGTRDVTRKALIIVRPEPQYAEEARAARVSGTVVLKVVLSSSGKVTGIETLKSLPRGLTEKAMEAARQLVFLPAIKDGQFVSQTVQVEYNFSVY